MPRLLDLILSKLPQLAESFMRLIADAACVLCKQTLALSEKDICSNCLVSLEKHRLPAKKQRRALQAGPINESYALFDYAGSFRDFLAAFKFHRSPWLIKSLRPSLKKFLLAVSLETRYDALIPIPMTLPRFIEQQFNPAETLAQEIGRISGIPVLPLLSKTRATPAQHDLSGEERRINLRGCFKARQGHKISGCRLLLIDDVFTTGSTASEAGKTLKQAGAQTCGILTLARTPKIKL